MVRNRESTKATRSRRTALVAGTVAIALGSLVAVSWHRGRNVIARRPQNVLLITIDTLRADRLGCYGFTGIATPHMDGLARDGLLFEKAIATAPITLPSHASIFTGLYPIRHGVRDNVGYRLGDEQEALAEILNRQGFSTAGFVSAYVLDGMWGLSQGFDLYYDDFRRFEMMGMDESERSGAETIARWEAWLGAGPRSPHFAWIHLFEPHFPYRPPEPYRSLHPQDAYVGEVAYTDALVGRILDTLEGRGLLDSTLVILTADHGEGLGEHGENTHSFFIYNSTLRVPLILRGPSVSPGRVANRVVSIVDILPTVLELVGLPEQADLDGESLIRARQDRPVYSETLIPKLHYGWSPLFALQDVRYKHIQAPQSETFDLERDPGETESVKDSPEPIGRGGGAPRYEPDNVAPLREKLREIVARAGEPAPADSASPEQLARLAALGYTGAGGAPRRSTLQDPKDKLDIFNRLEEGWSYLRVGDAERARALAKELTLREATLADAFYLGGRASLALKDYSGAATSFGRASALVPDSLVYLHAEARALEYAGNGKDAVAAYGRILERDPRDVLALLRLGALAFGARNLGEAETRFKQVLDIDPRSAQAESNLGNVAASRGDLSGAERHFLRALELDPRVDNAHLNLGVLYEEKGDLDRAESEYRKEIEVATKNVRAYQGLGLLLGKRGRRPGAIEAFRRALELAPASAIDHYLLGDALFRANRNDEAFGPARRAVELDPTMEPARKLVLAIEKARKERAQ